MPSFLCKGGNIITTNDLSFLSKDIIEKINYYEMINHNNEKAIYKLYIIRELVDDALSDMDGE